MNIASNGLAVEKVHVWRGVCHVLKGVSCRLEAGELMHVSGRNGAGKTTLLRVAGGLLRPEQGEVTWAGGPADERAPHYRRLLAFAAHEPALKADLTALENLHFLVGLRRPASPAALLEDLRRTGVESCAGLPARVLSAGQRRRVEMARVLASRAVVWLLDEPFSNLDAAGAALMSQLLNEHVAAGGLAMVAAHHELDIDVQTRHLDLS
ncbi:MAG: heme ABC exporter ATP-binding protein CcmA [Pseudomonadota bacterium]|nr:heme ABC exporter ATP-binding protein CcmA [Pseudomonadota bacterium]